MTLLIGGDRNAVWFGFEHKNHLNRKIKMHAVRLGWFLKGHPNQCDYDRFGGCGLRHNISVRVPNNFKHQKNNLNFPNNIKIPIKVVYPK
jgi:hypothetical protein